MIFVSTGGFRGVTVVDAAKILYDAGIKAIELSGGEYSETLLGDLRSFDSKTYFQVHNYFPPSKEPFVFNLGSLDENVAKHSIAHAQKSIHWAADIGMSVYSFHAGFLFEPKVLELGKRIEKKQLYDRASSLAVFTDRVNDLAKLAKKEGCELLVENNVLSHGNFEVFGQSPFLMCTVDECLTIMNNTAKNVNLLVDVAHLKVSARTLGYDPASMFDQCGQWVKGYHLSDNDGLSDSNKPVRDDSWFWQYLNPDVDYHTLEIYGVTTDELLQQVSLTNLMLE